MKTREELLKEKAEIESQIAALNRKAYELCQQAGHNIEKLYESAYCECCDRDFGWYCPNSPDKTCHYSTERGKVSLITGDWIDMPVGHDTMYESEDSCIYCGEPSERK
jgi:hypothetical protein